MTASAVEDLTLLLLYLTSWEERVYDDLVIRRAWKGFRFEALDALEEARYFDPSRRAKSMMLTEAGVWSPDAHPSKPVGGLARAPLAGL